MTEYNTVYIGRKPPMNYVMALITAFNASNAENVVLKARGRAISRAVDVAEIARRRFLRNVSATKIEIGSEQLPALDGGTHNVSTIAITLRRMKEAGVPEEELEAHEVDVEGHLPLSMDLSEIKGVGEVTQEKLINGGFTTVESVAASDPHELSEKTGISEKVAEKLIESAKELTT